MSYLQVICQAIFIQNRFFMNKYSFNWPYFQFNQLATFHNLKHYNCEIYMRTFAERPKILRHINVVDVRVKVKHKIRPRARR